MALEELGLWIVRQASSTDRRIFLTDLADALDTF